MPDDALASIALSAHVGIVSADAEGLVVFANEHAAHLAGRDRDEMLGRPIEAAIGAENAPAIWLWGERGTRWSSGDVTLERGRGETYNARFWTSSTEVRGECWTTVSFIDVSAKKAKEAELAASEERFRRLAESAPIGIFSRTTAGSAFLNRAAIDILGPDAAGLGADWTVRVHPDDRDAARERYAAAIETYTTYHEVLRFRRNDGATRLVEVHASPVLGPDGSVSEMVGTIVDVTQSRRYQLQTEALRRVATAAASAGAKEVFSLVAQEVAGLFDSDGAAVARVFDDGAELVGQWQRCDELRMGDGQTIPTSGDGATAKAIRTGAPSRSEQGKRVSIAAPIWVHGGLWGVVGAVSLDQPGLPAEAEQRLGAFAQLLEATIASEEARRNLEFRADRDHLTGLWNHRQFHERLAAEVARATRSGDPLSLVLIDLDRFKQVNDVHGHQAGDDVLKEAAARVTGAARVSDVVARVGGEELAWLLPDTDADGAIEAAERLRRAFHGEEWPAVGTQTASFGVADMTEASEPSEIYHQADVALYYAKQTGRDRCVRYSFEVAEDLIRAKAEARGIESPMLAGLRALGWSMDRRSAALSGHSERVADLAVSLGAALNWPIETAAQLREAALAHGVGQLGLGPDVTSGRPLTERERDELQHHRDENARTAAELLEEEQVRWVVHHLERYDGRGYPDGLSGSDVPDGAYLIGLAEAWDRLTAVGDERTGETLTADAAMEVVQAGRGKRFLPLAVDALARIREVGALPQPDRAGEPAPAD